MLRQPSAYRADRTASAVPQTPTDHKADVVMGYLAHSVRIFTCPHA